MTAMESHKKSFTDKCIIFCAWSSIFYHSTFLLIYGIGILVGISKTNAGLSVVAILGLIYSLLFFIGAIGILRRDLRALYLWTAVSVFDLALPFVLYLIVRPNDSEIGSDKIISRSFFDIGVLILVWINRNNYFKPRPGIYSIEP